MVVLFVILLTYLIVNLFGYVAHWSLHQTWMGRFNNAHMTHHLKLYPPEDFTSDTYRHAGKDSTPKFFAIAAIPLIIAPIILGVIGVLPMYLMVIILISELIIGFLHDYIHDAFHINNHWISCIPGVRVIFGRLLKLHYLHHVDMKRNYGIFAYHWDRVFGTFSKNNE